MYNFIPHATYTRGQVFEVLGISDPGGGDWYTGYTKHNDAYFIFCHVGTAGRTGHDYHNRFIDGVLEWRGKTNSRLGQPRIQEMLDPKTSVYVFYRESDRTPFTFAGIGKPAEVFDESPVRILWSFSTDAVLSPVTFAEEIPAGQKVVRRAKNGDS